MKKGDITKNKILSKALEMASKTGLECLSIGALATQTGMSKSGLFAHFNSKENLQLHVMEYAGVVFTDSVIIPALKKPSGIERIKAVVRNWIDWTKNLSGGCIFVAAPAEYTDRPGKVRDYVMEQQKTWINTLKRFAEDAVKNKEFKAGTDCEIFAFELYSIILGFFLYHNSLGQSNIDELMNNSIERLLKSFKN